jgi:GNAT superfamily N-acetyltransferase
VNRDSISSPTPISQGHRLETFDCGVPSLNDWLRKQALRNERNGASRTYVSCAGDLAVGYYCLSTGAVVRGASPKPMQRNMPDPIPVVILGRLAVDTRYGGQGLGTALLRDAAMRVLHAADSIGIKAILVHAISEEARRFYLDRGFLSSPIEPMTLCLPLDTARQGLATSDR